MLHCLFYLLVFNQPLPLTIAFFSSSGLRRCLKLAPPACYRKRVRYPVSRSTHEKRQSFRLSFCVERETGSLPHATLPVLFLVFNQPLPLTIAFFSSSGLRRCLKLAHPACYRKRVRYPVSHSTQNKKRQSLRLSFCVERETGFGPATFTLAR